MIAWSCQPQCHGGTQLEVPLFCFAELGTHGVAARHQVVRFGGAVETLQESVSLLVLNPEF